MDLALYNLQRLICHKTNQPTNQPGDMIAGLLCFWFELLLNKFVARVKLFTYDDLNKKKSLKSLVLNCVTKVLGPIDHTIQAFPKILSIRK